MNKYLNWYERVFEELKNEQSYLGRDSYYEFIEYLNDSLIFEKKVANKHPVIELYDFQHEVRVCYIYFDPVNSLFYLPVYNDEIEMKMHIILDSFEDIQKFFVGSWIRYSRLFKDGYENESKDVSKFQNILDIMTQ
ncbi:hypothetical protein WQ54_23085 [Bacillus sp. SA1-12]|uniref:hypothetical protein n=1 Tax=Bacillus sp. SA1-12 TaxID=1455638 RepID=UPI000626F507|nr:hypothetical protein [Bacillus sp. SA1-12]KKI90016.1 hypothetical protein WQ54_23085 [Bacillus sp. SA1-12]